MKRTQSIERLSRADRLPLSFMEEDRLIFESQTPGCLPINGSVSFVFLGRLNIDALRLSLNELIWRQEVLRTRFAAVQNSDQESATKYSANVNLRFDRTISTTHCVDLVIHKLGQFGTSIIDCSRQKIVADLMEHRFNYSDPPLMRAALITTDDCEHQLILTFPHLVFDGFCIPIVETELRSLYSCFCSGTPVSLPALPIQYVDFAAWQRQRLQGDLGRRLASFWAARWAAYGRAQLHSSNFPFAEIGSVRTPNCREEITQWAAQFSTRIKEFAIQARITPFIFLLSAFMILMHRYSGRSRIAIWGYFANRMREELSNLIGWFANAQLIGLDLTGDPSALSILTQTRSFVCDALDNQEIPLPVTASLAPESNVDNPLLVDAAYVSFDMQVDKTSREFMMPDGVLMTRAALPPPKQWPALALTVTDSGATMNVRARFAKDRFRDAALKELLDDFRSFTAKIIDAPDTRVSEFRLTRDT